MWACDSPSSALGMGGKPALISVWKRTSPDGFTVTVDVKPDHTFLCTLSEKDRSFVDEGTYMFDAKTNTVDFKTTKERYVTNGRSTTQGPAWASQFAWHVSDIGEKFIHVTESRNYVSFRYTYSTTGERDSWDEAREGERKIYPVPIPVPPLDY